MIFYLKKTLYKLLFFMIVGVCMGEVQELNAGNNFSGSYASVGQSFCVLPGNAILTNNIEATCTNSPMLMDCANTNSIVIRCKSNDQIFDLLKITGTGVTVSADAFTVSGSSVLTSANLSGALVASGPATLSSLIVTDSGVVGGALTTSGSVSINDGLLVTGTIIQGQNGAVVLKGSKLLNYNITSATTTTTAFTVNFTTTTASARVRVYIFGTASNGDISYSGELWVTPNTAASTASSESTNESGVAGGGLSSNFIRQPATNSVDVFYSYNAGRTLYSPYLFYEAYGNNLVSIT